VTCVRTIASCSEQTILSGYKTKRGAIRFGLVIRTALALLLTCGLNLTLTPSQTRRVVAKAIQIKPLAGLGLRISWEISAKTAAELSN
jgi:hypothetical protein